MATLSVFESLSLDGFFTDSAGDMSWAHAGADDPEFAAFTAGNAEGGGTLVFGGVTYRMMASWWPTPAAAAAMPVVAERMNALPKVAFSRTLERADWSNTRLFRSDPVEVLRELKASDGPDLVVLGSGSIVAQAFAAGLVDELQLVTVPVVIGAGRTLFEGVAGRRPMRLVEERSFANGRIFSRWTPR